VVPRDRILDHTRELAAGIARGAPLVCQALKEFMRATAHMSPEQAHQVTRQAWIGKSGLENYERMLSSDDFNEGARAFSEKRGPAFKGT
jgi:crotonobetainyl-CoA hydratase